MLRHARHEAAQHQGVTGEVQEGEDGTGGLLHPQPAHKWPLKTHSGKGILSFQNLELSGPEQGPKTSGWPRYLTKTTLSLLQKI